jgi:hypothetical protein
LMPWLSWLERNFESPWSFSFIQMVVCLFPVKFAAKQVAPKENTSLRKRLTGHLKIFPIIKNMNWHENDHCLEKKA